MQDVAAVARYLVIPIDHGYLVARVDGILVDILRDIDRRRRQRVLHFRILLRDDVAVDQSDVEEVPRFLDIGYSRFPEQVQKIQLPDVNVSDAVVLLRIPEHARDSGAGFQLVPPHIAVRLFVLILLQHDRQDLRQQRRVLLVALLARQHDRFRIVVHSVRVLIGYNVKKPCTRRLGRYSVFLFFALAHHVPMSEFVPLFIFNDKLFQI